MFVLFDFHDLLPALQFLMDIEFKFCYDDKTGGLKSYDSGIELTGSEYSVENCQDSNNVTLRHI